MGGYVFVSSGLILAAANEAEFAGMLSHAMAHVAARHGTVKTSGAESSGPANSPIVFVGSGISLDGDDSYLDALEADRVATNVMAAAGYDPAALLSYLKRREIPDGSVRLSRLQQFLRTLPVTAKQNLGDDFAAIQGEVRSTRRVPSLLHPNK